MAKPKAFINWSSGKDATMALYKMLQEKEYSVEKLFTVVNRENDRISMHGLHRSLLEAQAKAIGIPLEILELNPDPSMDSYNAGMKQKLEKFKSEGFDFTIFGDIFLEDLKVYRENQLKPTGVTPLFPIWKIDSVELLKGFIANGFKAILVCTDAQLLPKEFCGRVIDESFLDDLPEGVDPCGENGEFHTFCFDGPIFKHPVPFTKGEIVYKTYPKPNAKDDSEEIGFWYCDLFLENR